MYVLWNDYHNKVREHIHHFTDFPFFVMVRTFKV